MERLKIAVANAGGDLFHRLQKLAASAGLDMLRNDSPEAVISQVRERSIDLVIACSNGNDPQGSLALTHRIRRMSGTLPVVIVTGQSSEELAIAALRAGANDYFKLPLADDSLRSSLARLLPDSTAPSTASLADRSIRTMVGGSRGMQDVREYIARVAVSDSTVLITGETGTGKELAADMIHRHSPRRNNPLIRINCSALPDNLIESELFGYERGAFTGAQVARKGKLLSAGGGGGVFFDEIGDMNTFAQAKILRSIESKEVYPLGSNRSVILDFRIIAATNRDLEQQVSEGKFRADLYYRLNVARVQLPPLRQRKADIPELIAFTLKRLNRRFKSNIQGLTDSAMACLLRYDWPGNVRELINLLEAVYINLPPRRIDMHDLPPPFLDKLKADGGRLPNERSTIVSALVRTQWNKTATARKLNWSRMTLYRKLAKYSIVEKRNPPR